MEKNAPVNSASEGLTAKEAYLVDLLETKYSFEHDGKGFRETILRVSIKSES